MKNDKFDPENGLANLEKLPESLRGPLKEGVSQCRTADAGTLWNSNFGKQNSAAREMALTCAFWQYARELNRGSVVIPLPLCVITTIR
jgi:hypothetical protein